VNNYVFGPSSQIKLYMSMKFVVLWWWA